MPYYYIILIYNINEIHIIKKDNSFIINVKNNELLVSHMELKIEIKINLKII